MLQNLLMQYHYNFLFVTINVRHISTSLISVSMINDALHFQWIFRCIYGMYAINFGSYEQMIKIFRDQWLFSRFIAFYIFNIQILMIYSKNKASNMGNLSFHAKTNVRQKIKTDKKKHSGQAKNLHIVLIICLYCILNVIKSTWT